MTKKTLFTREQAKAFDDYVRIRKGESVQYFAKERGTFEYDFISLNPVSVDEFARACYCGGYEIDTQTEEGEDNMTGLRVGDKVMITNLSGILFGNIAWKEHDITEVIEVLEGYVSLRTTIAEPPTGPFRISNGVPVFTVTRGEYQSLAKLMPVNAEPTPPKVKEKTFKAGDRVKFKRNHPYNLFGKTTGTVQGRAERGCRGDYDVFVDGYTALSFDADEMEPLEKFAAGTRVFVKDTGPYGSLDGYRLGTVLGYARDLGHTRGELLVDLDAYLALSFNRNELEVIG